MGKWCRVTLRFHQGVWWWICHIDRREPQGWGICLYQILPGSKGPNLSGSETLNLLRWHYYGLSRGGRSWWIYEANLEGFPMGCGGPQGRGWIIGMDRIENWWNFQCNWFNLSTRGISTNQATSDQKRTTYLGRWKWRWWPRWCVWFWVGGIFLAWMGSSCCCRYWVSGKVVCPCWWVPGNPLVFLGWISHKWLGTL